VETVVQVETLEPQILVVVVVVKVLLLLAATLTVRVVQEWSLCVT
jgi:hypothetical protein